MSARLAVAMSIAFLAFGAGWAVNGWRLGEQIAMEREAIARDAAAAATTAMNKAAYWQRVAGELDEQYTQDIRHAHAEIERLRDSVAAGRQRLQLRAECPARVPAEAGATGVDDAAGPRLTDAAERDYWRLRERIETATGQIDALQQYIRAVCLSEGP